MDKNGYTTRNSVQNATHFLNFSDSSSTGTGAIQKTAGIECNPSTKTVTATKFVGDLSGNALSVESLQLSTSTIIPSLINGNFTLGCDNLTQRNFTSSVTQDVSGLILINPRLNGIYTLTLINISGSSWTISSVLTGGGNRTNYSTATIVPGQTWVMTIKRLFFNGTIYNCVSLERFV
jgi:hypothetical protein